MPKLSVCIEMIYDDVPFTERVSRAAVAGADAVEFWDWRERDLDAITAAADDAAIPIVGCTAGGVLTDPGQIEETIETIRESITTASELSCRSLIVTTGPDQKELDRKAQHETVVDVLSTVAPAAEAADVTIVLEPLNTVVDHPNYYLTSSMEGYEIVNEVNSSNVKLLFDIYHQQITEGNVIQNITEHSNEIGHIHIADVPGRHEPGTGELNYENIFGAIDKSGYEGYVGCEFSPMNDADEAVATVVNWC